MSYFMPHRPPVSPVAGREQLTDTQIDEWLRSRVVTDALAAAGGEPARRDGSHGCDQSAGGICYTPDGANACQGGCCTGFKLRNVSEERFELRQMISSLDPHTFSQMLKAAKGDTLQLLQANASSWQEAEALAAEGTSLITSVCDDSGMPGLAWSVLSQKCLDGVEFDVFCCASFPSEPAPDAPDAKTRGAMVRICASCGQQGAKKRCGSCHETAYCNRDCQVAHWKQGHKLSCTKASKPRAGSVASATAPDRRHLLGGAVRNERLDLMMFRTSMQATLSHIKTFQIPYAALPIEINIPFGQLCGNQSVHDQKVRLEPFDCSSPDCPLRAGNMMWRLFEYEQHPKLARLVHADRNGRFPEHPLYCADGLPSMDFPPRMYVPDIPISACDKHDLEKIQEYLDEPLAACERPEFLHWNVFRLLSGVAHNAMDEGDDDRKVMHKVMDDLGPMLDLPIMGHKPLRTFVDNFCSEPCLCHRTS